MYYVYVLKDINTGGLYIGRTSNLARRMCQHNSGKSKYTKRSLWKIVYIEGYADELDAKKREHNLKQFGRVYSQLKRRILRSLS